jgi:hypothetical protein
MTTVKSRIHRTLNDLPSFQAIDSNISLSTDIENLRLRENESILGIYKNESGTLDETIVITELGLHIFMDSFWKSIDFNEIERVEKIQSKEDDHLVLKLNGDKKFSLPVRGGKEQFRDSMTFLRFLNRVLEDRKIERK